VLETIQFFDDDGELFFTGNPFRVMHEVVDLGVTFDRKLMIKNIKKFSP